MKIIYFITSDNGVWHGFHWNRGPYPFKRIAQKADSIKSCTGMDLRIMVKDGESEKDITDWVWRIAGF